MIMNDTLKKISIWFPLDDLIQLDGMDDAIMGIEANESRLIYSVSKCIEILSHEMDDENASAYFFEVLCPKYYGPNSPIYCLDNL